MIALDSLVFGVLLLMMFGVPVLIGVWMTRGKIWRAPVAFVLFFFSLGVVVELMELYRDFRETIGG